MHDGHPSFWLAETFLSISSFGTTEYSFTGSATHVPLGDVKCSNDLEWSAVLVALASDWPKHFWRVPYNNCISHFEVCPRTTAFEITSSARIVPKEFLKKYCYFLLWTESKMITLSSDWMRHFRYKNVHMKFSAHDSFLELPSLNTLKTERHESKISRHWLGNLRYVYIIHLYSNI